MKLLGISGSLSGWKTNVIIHHVLEAAENHDSSIETELIDLRDLDVEFARGEPLAFYNEDTFDIVNKIDKADCLVFGTPIYQASITGALKNLLDHLPVDALKGKVTGIVTTGSVEKHFLVAEYQLKPILTYLKGFVPTNNVFAHHDSFSDVNEIIDDDITKRINSLAEEIIFLQQTINSK